MSSRARKRHEKGLERAEEIVDRTAVKVAKSKKSASSISLRKKNWDDINSATVKAAKAGSNMFGALGGDGDEDEDVEEVDEFDEEMEVVQEDIPAAVSEESAAAPTPVHADDDEDIL